MLFANVKRLCNNVHCLECYVLINFNLIWFNVAFQSRKLRLLHQHSDILVWRFNFGSNMEKKSTFLLAVPKIYIYIIYHRFSAAVVLKLVPGILNCFMCFFFFFYEGKLLKLSRRPCTVLRQKKRSGSMNKHDMQIWKILPWRWFCPSAGNMTGISVC